MILWTSKPTSDNPSEYVDLHRWVIELTWYGIGLCGQYHLRESNEWKTSHSNTYAINFTRHFCLGPEHSYYDGPHCFFSLGWVHIKYVPRGGWCKKCMPD